MTASNDIAGGLGIASIARALCHDEAAREIAGQEYADAFEDSDDHVQSYWIALARVAARLSAPAEVDARVEAMRSALEPFAALAETWVGDDEDDSDTYHHSIRFPQGRVKVGWLRAASAALYPAQPTGVEA